MTTCLQVGMIDTNKYTMFQIPQRVKEISGTVQKLNQNSDSDTDVQMNRIAFPIIYIMIDKLNILSKSGYIHTSKHIL
jgi:hypothetical protein